MINKITKYVTDKDNRFIVNAVRGFYNSLSDEEYLKRFFRAKMKKDLNLDNPTTFNEKLQWLKINDHNPEYTKLVDKYEVKEYISSVLGEEYIIPTLGVWDSFDEIDFDVLPDQFVLKCTHDSGGLVIVKDKSKIDKDATKKKINKSLKRNYFYYGREWPYKNVPPKIIAEKFMVDSSGGFTDYKFFCFDGKVDCVMVCLDRDKGDTKFYFFDKDWNLKRLNKRGMAAPEGFTITKPPCIDEMFDIAAKLSKGMAFVRVDLYEVFGKIYFGEMTFYPDSGFDANILPETDKYFGSLIKLKKKGDRK